MRCPCLNATVLLSSGWLLSPSRTALLKSGSAPKQVVDEFGVRAVMYRHRKSGAEVLSVEAPDENKVFGITFRTPPKDSTGVPHILGACCGTPLSFPSLSFLSLSYLSLPRSLPPPSIPLS